MITGSAGTAKPRSPRPSLMYTKAFSTLPSFASMSPASTGPWCCDAHSATLLMRSSCNGGGVPSKRTSTSTVPVVAGSIGVTGRAVCFSRSPPHATGATQAVKDATIIQLRIRMRGAIGEGRSPVKFWGSVAEPALPRYTAPRSMRRLRIGSAEHKARFCRAFVETHHAYAPDQMRWPALDADALARLRGLPFWGEAVGSERTAAARGPAMGDVGPGPRPREADPMQGDEEERHAYLLDHLLTHYGIPHPDEKAQAPRDAEWGFMRMGYGECFDSFFAFGLFRIAADTGFFAPALVEIFDGVMQEEARHILF